MRWKTLTHATAGGVSIIRHLSVSTSVLKSLSLTSIIRFINNDRFMTHFHFLPSAQRWVGLSVKKKYSRN